MLFRDRFHGGQCIVPYLTKYKSAQDAAVIGLPRGGVQTAYEVAQGLALPLDIYSLKKIGAPFNPELALGAVSATGELFLNQDLLDTFHISSQDLAPQIAVAKQQAVARLHRLRGKKPPVTYKTVILVDDGLATGATMKAAILTARAQGVGHVVVAVPVSARDTYQEIQELADEVVVVSLPPYFQAVGQFYEDFSQVEDEEVIELLHKM